MLFYLAPIIIIIICSAVIIRIIVKNFSRLAGINIESIAAEKESRVRDRLMIERLSRQYGNLRKIIIEISRPVAQVVNDLGNNLYKKIIQLEQRTFAQPLEKIDTQQLIKGKLEELRKILPEKDYQKIEEESIAIIKLDPENADVYEFLSESYREQKEYKKARETSRYLIKLLLKAKVNNPDKAIAHRLANSYADLGSIYQSERKNNYALANFQKAVELELNNPRYLDLLLKISILLKNKNLALKTFASLSEADPGNQKLAEIKEEIDKLPQESTVE